MSGQLSSTLMFVSLVAIALAANEAEQYENASSIAANRGPAAVLDAKSAKERMLGASRAAPRGKHTEKLRGPLAVRLEMMGSQQSAVGETFVVRGTVSTREPLDTVDFAWSLPPG